MSRQGARLAAVWAHITGSDFSTTITLADETTCKGIAGKSSEREVEQAFGTLTVAELMDRGGQDVTLLAIVPADYTPERFSRPFKIGLGESARLYQCYRAAPLRDGDAVQYWQLLIYTGGLKNE